MWISLHHSRVPVTWHDFMWHGMPYLKWWQPVPRACNEASVMRVQLDKHSDVRPRQWLLTAAMASSPTFWKTPRTSVNTQQKALQQTKNMGKHIQFLENWPRSIISPGLREFTQCLGSHLQAAHLHYALSLAIKPCFSMTASPHAAAVMSYRCELTLPVITLLSLSNVLNNRIAKHNC